MMNDEGDEKRELRLWEMEETKQHSKLSVSWFWASKEEQEESEGREKNPAHVKSMPILNDDISRLGLGSSDNY